MPCSCFPMTKRESLADIPTESQDESKVGQVCPAWCQLQLQLDHPCYAFDLVRHLQRHQVSSTTERCASMGKQYQRLASEASPCRFLRFTRHLRLRLCWILPRRPQEGREGRRLLHAVRSRLVHPEHGDVGFGRGHPAEQPQQQQEPGRVGMVLRAKPSV